MGLDSAFPFDRGGLEPVGKGRRGKGAEARAAGGWEDNAGGQLGKFPQMDFLKMCCVVVMMGGCLLTERTAVGQRSTGRRRDDRYAMP